ncbi:SgcJ/EcaC family oxidoreductase [Pseudonocardia yunnanensis]|uniref:SgcJ/EcaC family oxidoreductase n=1 Tax=Pseudonocardia yunnanensis TaxID=58107 RepID=A0ABW4ER12_9PSEU
MSATTPGLVDDTLARMAAAWNAGDAAAYASLFTADATYVAFNGQMMRGRTAIEDGHRWLFEGPLRSSRMTHAAGTAAAEHHIRFIRPDVALVHTAGGGVQLAGTAELTPDRESVVSLVLVEDGGSWQIAAFQNTRRQHAGPKP